MKNKDGGDKSEKCNHSPVDGLKLWMVDEANIYSRDERGMSEEEYADVVNAEAKYRYFGRMTHDCVVRS